MQAVKCYYCDSDDNKLYDSENGFNLVQCNICGLLYVNPRPKDQKINESSKIGEHKGTRTIKVTGSFDKWKIKKYIGILDDFFTKESILVRPEWLDIGCGHGEFLFALKKYSNGRFIIKGVEPNIDKQNSAKSKNLDVGNFDLDNHNHKYDIISFLNVYSHLPDPPKTLASWKNLLKPEGLLFMETGDIAPYEETGIPKPYNLPDHLSFASEKIVVDILQDCGFEVLQVKKYPLIDLDFINLTKQIVKAFLPNKTSHIRRFFNNKNSDMFIKAKLKS